MAVVILGILLGAVAFAPDNVIQWPYENYGWIGVVATLILLAIISYLLIVVAVLLWNLIGSFFRFFFQINTFLIVGRDKVKKEMIAIVMNSKKFLSISGSRARDSTYLNTIENHLSNNNVMHTRVFFGMPKYKESADHIEKLRKIRLEEDASEGESSIKIGIYQQNDSSGRNEPERNFCISEKRALFILPSINGLAIFDTALIVVKRKHISGWRDYCEQLYAACDIKIKTIKDFEAQNFSFVVDEDME